MPVLSGKLSGHVRDKTGRPIQGASVSGYVGNPELTILQTDESGSFTFGFVAEGIYNIRAQAKGYMSDLTSAQVLNNEVSSIDFKLRRGDSVLSGKVLGESESNPLAAEVYLYKQGLVLAQAKTLAENGEFTFPDLVQDNYAITVHATCHEAGEWSGLVNGRTQLKLTLLPKDGCVSIGKCDVCNESKEVKYCRFCHAYICSNCRHNYSERIRAMLRRHFQQSGKNPEQSKEEYETEVDRALSEPGGCSGCP